MVTTREFTKEEMSKTYFKYYYVDMPVQSQQLLDKIRQKPIDSKDELKIEDINDLLDILY